MLRHNTFTQGYKNPLVNYSPEYRMCEKGSSILFFCVCVYIETLIPLAELYNIYLSVMCLDYLCLCPRVVQSNRNQDKARQCKTMQDFHCVLSYKKILVPIKRNTCTLLPLSPCYRDSSDVLLCACV